jgi:hypothetical protein
MCNYFLVKIIFWKSFTIFYKVELIHPCFPMLYYFSQFNVENTISLTSVIWLMYSLYKNEYRIFKPVKTIIRKGLRQNEEK